MHFKTFMRLGITYTGAVTVLLSAVVAQQSTAQTISSNRTGNQGGYYYSFWTDGGGSVSMTLGSNGNYSVTWNNCSNFTCGKGWQTGSSAPVSFNGSFNGGSNGYLAIYGWTKNPLVEYYIIETYGAWTPPGGTSLGTLTSDGGTYNIYKIARTNQASIIGTASFTQYWSVRTTKRSGGTVTVGNHFNAWKSHGMNMGSFDYEIVETEGWKSSGSSNITVGVGTSVVGNGFDGIHLGDKEITVALPSNMRFNTLSFQIFDISGKRLFASSAEPNNELLKISNLDLFTGAYYVSIQSQDRRLVVPFVKMK
jgi:endo-1,4-beta-xylanase